MINGKKKYILIRIFGDLELLLRERALKNPHSKEIHLGQTVKDMIESLGIPHTEVLLILVNNEVKDFGYLLKDADKVSIYPKFYELDISELSTIKDYNAANFKFILDVHLGKLAKNLRMLGFDSKYKNNYNDLQIIQTGISEERIILTRDVGILKYAKVKWGYLIRSHNPKEQTIEILNRYNLVDKIQPYIRCIECNELLTVISKKKIIDQLGPKTRMFFDKFKYCSKCNRIYWGGSHLSRMNFKINQILEDCVFNHGRK